MKAFILAAGKGERLKPFTDVIPKPLLPVLGRPVICYSLARLRLAGINDLIINIHHLGSKIKDFFYYHNDFGFNIHFSEEKELLGTGGALKKCSHLLDKPFFLLNADILTDLAVFDLLKAWNINQKSSLLVLSPEPSGEKFTVAAIENRVVDFNDLAGSGKDDNFDYIGQAILDPHIFEYLPEGNSALTTNGFLKLVENKELGYMIHNGWWFDTGTQARLRKAEKFLRTRRGVVQNLVREEVEPRLSYLFRLYKNLGDL